MNEGDWQIWVSVMALDKAEAITPAESRFLAAVFDLVGLDLRIPADPSWQQSSSRTDILGHQSA